MTCNALLLARYLDNRLSGDELLDCLNHAMGCQTCRQALMEVRRYQARSHYKQPNLVPVPTGFAAGLLQTLQQVRLEPAELGESLWDDTEIDEVFEKAAPPKRVSRMGRPSLDWAGLIVVVLRSGPTEERILAKAVRGCLKTVRQNLAQLEQDGVIVRSKEKAKRGGKPPNVWSLKPDQVGIPDISPEKVAQEWTWKNEVEWGNRVQKKNGLMSKPMEETMTDDKELELKVVTLLSQRTQLLITELAAFAVRVDEYRRDLAGLQEVRPKRPGREQISPYDDAIQAILLKYREMSTPEITRCVQMAVPQLASLRFDSARAIIFDRLQSLLKRGLIQGIRVKGAGRPWRWSPKAEAKSA